MFAKVASPTLPRSLNTRALNAALLSGSYNLDIGPSPPRSSFLNTGTGPSLLHSSCYQGQGIGTSPPHGYQCLNACAHLCPTLLQSFLKPGWFSPLFSPTPSSTQAPAACRHTILDSVKPDNEFAANVSQPYHHKQAGPWDMHAFTFSHTRQAPSCFPTNLNPR